MNAQRWNELRELFAASLEVDPSQRKTFVETKCADDGALRSELETMLESHSVDDSFLVPNNCVDSMLEAAANRDGAFTGRLIGSFKVTGLIAAGGMGEVYRATRVDDHYDEEVALKIVRRAVASPQLVRRFHFERQTLANLVHPNITRLLDGGTTECGLPYLVMELIEGQPIDRYANERHLTIPQRLDLFQAACSAVQHAHRNLIVHRDIKPSNVLVDRDGQVKLLDFGIAKLVEEDGVDKRNATTTGHRVLTPEYASPEQILGRSVSTATDVYSLGVLLYELLSGHRPYRLDNVDRHHAERIVCESKPCNPSTAVRRDPPPDDGNGPSSDLTALAVARARGVSSGKLRKILAGDLDRIVLATLHKDATKRYASVEQLSEDIRRYVRGFPIRAQKDTFLYRTRKLVGRHRGAAVASALALLVSAGGIALGVSRTDQARRTAQLQHVAALDAREDAVAARNQAQAVLSFLQEMLASGSPLQHGGALTVSDLLEEAERKIDHAPPGSDELEAGVRLTIGRARMDLCMWDRAIPHLQKSLALYRQSRGNDDLAVAECLSLLGRSLAMLACSGAKQTSQAMTMHREAWTIRRNVLGERHRLVAESTGSLGEAMWAEEIDHPPLKVSEQLFRTALGIYDEVGGETSAPAARFTWNLGRALHLQGRSADAEAAFDRAFGIYDAWPDSGGIDELHAIVAFADLLESTGRYDETLTRLDDFLGRVPQGLMAPEVCAVTWQKARVLARQRRFKLAEREYRRALAFECRLFSTKNNPLASQLDDCAIKLEVENNSADISSLLLKVMSVLDSVHTSNPRRYARRLGDLAVLMHSTGDALSARRMLERTLEIQSSILPNTDPSLCKTRAALTACIEGSNIDLAPVWYD